MATVQEAIRRLRIEATSTGVNETTAKIQQLDSATQSVTVSVQGQERATLSMEKRLASIQLRLDPVIRREQILSKLERELTAARQQGLITLERQNELLAMQAARLDRAAGSIGRYFGAGALERAGAFVGGLASGFAIGELMRLPRIIADTVDEAAKMVEVSDRIGITTKRLQELHYSAKLAEVEIGDLDKSMQIFGRNLGTALSGQGDLAKVLKLNNVAMRDQDGNVISVSRQLDIYADLLKNASSEQERLRLAQVAFGRGGAGMVSVLKDGSAVLREQGKEIDTVSDSMMRNAAEIDDKFDKLSTLFSTKFKTGVLAGAGALNELDNALGGTLLERLAAAVPFWGPMYQALEAFSKLKSYLSNQGAGADYPKSRQPAPIVSPATKLPDEQMEKLIEQLDKAETALRKQTAGLVAQANALGQSMGAAAAYTKQQELLNLVEQGGLKLSSGRVKAIEAEAAAYGRAIQALEEMNTLRDLRFEGSQLGRTGTEQRVASTLRGIYGDDWQSQANGAIAAQIRLNDTLETTQDLARDFTSSFISDLRGGATVVDALTGSLDKLADRLLDMAANAAINRLLAGLFNVAGAGVGSGSLGGLAGTIYHTGGMVGLGGASRYVHPAYFENAPRYHSGGRIGADERPVIAKVGEEVGWPRDLARKYGGSGVTNVKVEVVNQTSTPVQAEQRRKPNGDIQVVLRNANKKDMANGEYDDVMGVRYGLSPRGRQR